MVIDFEQYNPIQDMAAKDKGELTASKRLLKRVSENHRKLIGVVVYNTIAFSSKWINACIEANLEAVVRAKNNNKKSAQRLHDAIRGSELYIVPKMKHGEISLMYQEKYIELIKLFFAQSITCR